MSTDKSSKDLAYWERNQLVCYLSKIFYSWIEKHDKSDIDWENDYRNIVFIQLPENLASWHIHDSEKIYFPHLRVRQGNSWDGKSMNEKYEALIKKRSDILY
jgi:hypothetical protein